MIEVGRGGRRRLARAFGLVLLAALPVSCSGVPADEQPGARASTAPGPAPGTSAQTAETLRMLERLREFADRADPESNAFLSELRAESLAATPPPTELGARLRYDATYATELLNAGRTAEAITIFQSVWSRMEGTPELRTSVLGRYAHGMLALAHLRAGEEENCILHHGTDSCLLPIRGGGIHKQQRGSRAAIGELLKQDPSDLGARWLLNLAYMTVGEYPDGVPAKWLIPPRAFESDHDIGRFPDRAAAAGLDVVGLAGAAMMEDFDGDRYLDVLVTSWGLRDPMRLFINDRDGTFTGRTEEAGLAGIVSGLNAVHADYDNDGDMDVFVPRGAWLREGGRMPPSLLRNRGDGTFDDVTESANLLRYHPSQVAAWGDFDNDGWVDLFVGAESMSNGPAHPSELYRNNRDGTFMPVGLTIVSFVKGAAWGDYDNDGRLDLYVSVLRGTPSNMLLHNEGPDERGQWRFTDVAERAGVRGPASSFPTWFFDYDNDGWLDIFVSAYAGTLEDVAADYLGIGKREDGETPRLFRNRGDGTFSDVTAAARVERVLMTMGCNFGDLDNDGWLDFYAATGTPEFRTLVPNRMFRNAGGGHFQDVTTSGGFGHLQKGHGVAFGDIDNDGDQDVFLKVGGAFPADEFQSALFENPGHGNHWITLELVGVETNRAAIGARIRVRVEEPDGSRDIHATVTSGSSFGGSSLRQEIGLGRATRIRELEVWWPTTGKRQVFENVPLDQYLVIREGSPTPTRIALERLTLGGEVDARTEAP